MKSDRVWSDRLSECRSRVGLWQVGSGCISVSNRKQVWDQMLYNFSLPYVELRHSCNFPAYIGVFSWIGSNV